MSTQPLSKLEVLPIIRQRTLPALWKTVLCLIASDLASLTLAYWSAVLGRLFLNGQYKLLFYVDSFPILLVFIGVFLAQDLYPCILVHPAEELRRVFRSVSVVFLLIACSTFFWRNTDAYSRSIFLVMWLSAAPAVLIGRKLTRMLCSNKDWWGATAIMFGSDPIAMRVISHLHRRRDLGLRIVGLLSDSEPRTELPCHLPLLGDFEDGPALASDGIAQYAILATPEARKEDVKHVIQEYCSGFRHVLLVPNLPGLCGLDIVCREVGGEVGFEISQRLFHTWSAISKWLIDFVVSSSVLLISAPLLLAISIAIKATSHGPVLFGHSRSGRNGKAFKAWKFRTMYSNGDQILADHFKMHPARLAEWQRDQKLKNDPRVTPVGRFLRRYSLDEVPQLLNVLERNMSLVGPRPIINAEIARYGRSYGLYKRVLPGLTGLWQVSGRNNTSYAERVGFDEYYVRNWSVWLDAYILTRTVRTVITGHGAY